VIYHQKKKKKKKKKKQKKKKKKKKAAPNKGENLKKYLSKDTKPGRTST